MTMIVEDGSGIYEANSYAGLSFAQAYLTRRNRATAWNAATVAARQAALIAATDYIDKRFGPVFIGLKLYREMAVPAFNMISFLTNPTEPFSLVVGSVTYTFVASPSAPNDVEIGATVDVTVTNFVTALQTHPDVEGELFGTNIVIVRHRLDGEQDEVLTTSSNELVASWDYSLLIGGSDSTEQNLEWPREAAVYPKTGTAIEGIPEKLRQATVEYASRAISETLMPDPVTGDTGQEIRRQFEKVGPIETEIAYSQTVRQVFKKYPEADRLLTDLIGNLGGVYR